MMLPPRLMKNRDRVIRDSVHKDILVKSSHSLIIDTKEFQRLRHIRQLATCEFVFPNATHNRFSHSLGAYHLANELVQSLQNFQPGIITESDAELVVLGALLHDIGHPPLSHSLERPDVFATFHSHEHWGKLILDSEETEIGRAIRELLGEEKLLRFFAIMRGDNSHNGVEIPPFMKEIISSQLDVDRMDYLLRDQMFTGAQIGGFDIQRVIRSMRVGEDGYFYVKNWGLPSIESYLVTRYHMYMQVYYHKVNMLTQEYLIRLLKRVKQLSESGDLNVDKDLHGMLFNVNLSVEQYCNLNDSNIMVNLSDWSNSKDEILSSLASKLLSRSNYHKSLRIDSLTIEMLDSVEDSLAKFLEEKGVDPSVDMIVARISKKGYLPYKEGIKLENGLDVAHHSALIEAISKSKERALIFVPKSIRDDAEKFVREWVKPSQSSLSNF